MMDITFEIGGRKVSPNRYSDELEKAILTEVANSVKKALSSVTCPDHHQRPRVRVVGKDIHNLSWEVEGCCQKLIDSSIKKLK